MLLCQSLPEHHQKVFLPINPTILKTDRICCCCLVDRNQRLRRRIETNNHNNILNPWNYWLNLYWNYPKHHAVVEQQVVSQSDVTFCIVLACSFGCRVSVRSLQRMWTYWRCIDIYSRRSSSRSFKCGTFSLNCISGEDQSPSIIFYSVSFLDHWMTTSNTFILVYQPSNAFYPATINPQFEMCFIILLLLASGSGGKNQPSSGRCRRRWGWVDGRRTTWPGWWAYYRNHRHTSDW